MPNSSTITIQKIELPIAGIDELLDEARAEGYQFLDRLVKDWLNGENRFDAPGEILCGCLDQGLVVAVGALNIDPFAGRADVGRIRRVYVRAAWRNRGIGRSLVETLIEEAGRSFTSVCLRAESADAARLYERMGFLNYESPHASHILTLNMSNTAETKSRRPIAAQFGDAAENPT